MAAPDPAASLDAVRAYHRATRHDFRAFARGPGGLDWDTQPNPFRRYAGAPLVPLDYAAGSHSASPNYADVFGKGSLAPSHVDRNSVSRLFLDALGLSAWKQAGDARWALRVDPSSGNLHPTEGYLLCGKVEGLTEVPMLAHYAPREHVLEVRAEVPAAAWEELALGLPPGTFFVGISSIHWREAWKYGERAFRYCELDCGHVVACIAIAAAGLGWRVRLCDDLGHADLAALLGVGDPQDVEPEEPECLIAVCPVDGTTELPSGPPAAPAAFARLALRGVPNALSPDHVDWHAVDVGSEASRKPRTAAAYAGEVHVAESSVLLPKVDVPLRTVVHGRRSAVAFDGRTRITRASFLASLATTLRGPARCLPWAPRVHLGLFVHRVEGLEAGLYVLPRDPAALPDLRQEMQREFLWERADEELDLYRLARGDARSIARAVSCHQEIASDGAFALAMLAEFDAPLERHGAWFYRRLYWECGAVGQALYLAAEAHGVRATGIGCFFDEPTHEVFGIGSTRYRSLYHFTVGGPVEDERLQTWPAYPPRDERLTGGRHDAP